MFKDVPQCLGIKNARSCYPLPELMFSRTLHHAVSLKLHLSAPNPLTAAPLRVHYIRQMPPHCYKVHYV
jgi:hypothetical protein